MIVTIVAASTLGWSQQPATNSQKPNVRSVLENRLSAVEHDLVPAVEAMPEDKFTYVPTTGEYKGVNNFAQMVKHVASANFFYFAGFAPEKPPANATGETGPANLTSKSDIVKFLRDSFAYAHSAVATISDDNVLDPVNGQFGKGTRLGLTVGAIAHMMDHYGQMVEYLRLNGIIPPASRR
jgi:uncharacterized damage-inducible protein DinB